MTATLTSDDLDKDRCPRCGVHLASPLPLMGVQRPDREKAARTIADCLGRRQITPADYDIADAVLALIPQRVQRPEDVARALWQIDNPRADWDEERRVLEGHYKLKWPTESFATYYRYADALLALPHTGQPQEGWRKTLPLAMKSLIAEFSDEGTWFNTDAMQIVIALDTFMAALSAAPASPRETDAECERRLLDEEAADNLRLIDWIADKIGLPKNEELSRENFAQWLSARAPASPRAEGEKKTVVGPPKGWTPDYSYSGSNGNE